MRRIRAAMARPCTQKGARAAKAADMSNQLVGSEWRMAARSRTPTTSGVRFSVDQVKAPRPRRIPKAFSRVEARKNIQVEQTKWKVMRMPIALAHQRCDGIFRKRFHAK